MKKKFTKLTLFSFLFFFLLCGTSLVSAKAATYKPLRTDGKSTLIGSNYLWYEQGNIIISRKTYPGGPVASSKVVASAVNQDARCDGTYLFYSRTGSDGITIYRYHLSSGSRKKICYIKHGVEIVHIYNGNIYVCRHSFSGKTGHDRELFNSTYAYNLSKKTLRKVFSTWALPYGRYLYGRAYSDGTTFTLKVYDITTKKTKSVDTRVLNAQHFGNYIYYAKNVSSSSDSMIKVKMMKYHLKTGKRSSLSSKTFYCNEFISVHKTYAEFWDEYYYKKRFYY